MSRLQFGDPSDSLSKNSEVVAPRVWQGEPPVLPDEATRPVLIKRLPRPLAPKVENGLVVIELIGANPTYTVTNFYIDPQTLDCCQGVADHEGPRGHVHWPHLFPADVYKALLAAPRARFSGTFRDADWERVQPFIRVRHSYGDESFKEYDVRVFLEDYA